MLGFQEVGEMKDEKQKDLVDLYIEVLRTEKDSANQISQVIKDLQQS